MGRKHENALSDRWIGQIASDREEAEIIRYGLHQLFLIAVNAATIAGCALLWGQPFFCLLLFLIIFTLRPYAGGYHADTELRCYVLSVGVMNLAMLCRCRMDIPIVVSLLLYIGAAGIIWQYAPVANPQRPLDRIEVQRYAKKAKELVILLSIVAAAGIWLKASAAADAVFCGFFIIALSLLAGKWKYRAGSRRFKEAEELEWDT